MKEIQLGNDGIALVDDDVFEWAKNHKWSRSRAGYVVRSVKRAPKDWRTVYLHNEIVGKAPKPLVTDHRNRNRLDNRRENLRFVTKTLNALNWRSKNVFRHQGAWVTQIYCGTYKICISGIQTEAEAQSIAALLKGSLMYHELTKGQDCGIG